MSEQKRKPDDRTGAYILIGIGAILLLVNVFNVDVSRLWPLILIAIGLYLLLGRNHIGSAAHRGRFRAPVDGAETADYQIHLSVGEATIEPLPQGADNDDLFDAHLSYVGSIDFDVSGAAQRTIRLRQTGEAALAWINPANWFGSGENFHWQIALHRDIPSQVSIWGGVGRADLHLRDLNATAFNLRGGVGEIKGTLPQSDTGYRAHIQGGLGSLRLQLPAHTSIDLEVQGGVGEIKLDTDPNTALHIQTAGGISDVSVPARVNRISDENSDFDLGKNGTWESDDFAGSPHQVTIHYQGGLGSLHVR